MEPSPDNGLSYITPPSGNLPAKHLVSVTDSSDQQRFTFYERLEIRRRHPNPEPGVLCVDDPSVSARHCVVTQTTDGRCLVLDTSRNGTRLDGRRLYPNIEVEFSAGQVLSIGHGIHLRLEGEPARVAMPDAPVLPEFYAGTTDEMERRIVTVLVGDIRDYTHLVRDAPPALLQRSVNQLFERLEHEAHRFGGTVKEHQGDALFAYWEHQAEPRAVAACRAALALDRLVQRLAADRSVWALDNFPLHMEWALATGPVTIHSFGGHHPVGLSVIGEAVVLAFRLEKLGSDETGTILTCPVTREEAGRHFQFKDLGEQTVKGFDTPVRVFALIGAVIPASG